MRRLAIITLSACLQAFSQQTQAPATKHEAAMALLEASQAVKTVQSFCGERALLAAPMEPLRKMIPAEKQAEFDELFNQFVNNFAATCAKESPALTERLIPVYEKYYTVEDMQALIAFFRSPVGKKLLSTQPELSRESMKIGQEWGQEIGKKVGETFGKQLEELMKK